MNVKNIKLSILICRVALDNAIDILSQQNISVKMHPNFITFKGIFTYVLFKSSDQKVNHVNATKISSVDKITSCLEELANLLKTEVVTYKVDNIISTTSLSRPINLIDIVKKKKFKKVTYNSERFPGMFIRFDQGTSIVFHSGNIVIVGCRTLDDIYSIKKCLVANIETKF